ncbi:hypothetical protein [Falsihalocynthiibacter arcticus]|uniref:hypothetical protein n=1 Tax=Falsihalocynthiibacter arcticus TaxID=1579316 RepID=UPI0012E8D26F|nr:hypothetical protein [Falsihalocynthiibacter arcticus]
MPITEKQIRLAAVAELARSNTGTLTTTQLISRLTDSMNPVDQDAEILDGRSDTYFSQKVRNLVSHRNDTLGLQNQGLAIYNEDGESWTITEEGRSSV